MGSEPTYLLSNIEISRIAWRRGSTANELVVEVDADADDAADMEMEDRADKASIQTTTEFASHTMLPSTLSYSRPCTGVSVAARSDNAHAFPAEEKSVTEHPVSLSRPGSKDGRGGSLHATKVGIYESRPAFKDLGFRTYGYRH